MAKAQVSPPDLKQPFVTGSMETPVGLIPRVSSSLRWTDHLGTFKARWGISRMDYLINPGLYALGDPDEKSPVLVSANYKMSFDKLREALPGRNFWILVLDTKGINVWCAAGKGTFGTTEIVDRIEVSGLAQIVSHRELILPQLGGPGVAAHEVKRISGFKVIYGPIRATDLPKFLDAGLKATPEMRIKTFSVWERFELIPMELVDALKVGALAALILFVLTYLGKWSLGLGGAGAHALFSMAAILAAIFAGAVLTPLLLPWLPGRAFSLKGVSSGFIAALILFLAFGGGTVSTMAGRLEIASWFLLIPALSAFLAMNFTGASTYTSLSGVRKEMRLAVPLQVGGGIVGFILWLGSIFGI